MFGVSIFLKPFPKYAHVSNTPSECTFLECRVEILPLDLGGGAKSFAPARPEVFLEEQEFVECNSSRARFFHGQHGRDESPEAELFRLKVHRLLSKVQQLLDGLGVPFWISSGTCLGEQAF